MVMYIYLNILILHNKILPYYKDLQNETAEILPYKSSLFTAWGDVSNSSNKSFTFCSICFA